MTPFMIDIDQLYEIYLNHPLISTDTRKITVGSIFIALRGENFDANQFAEQALSNGASYAVVDDPEVVKGPRYLLVDNSLQALQQLAVHHRARLSIPVIGVTGTNGKTTTKELLHSVLSQHYSTYATQGNFNNHIGVPLTILSIPQQTEIAIIEMGANHIKEIEFLCNIAKPTHGLITNVGKAHLEGFGSFNGVKQAKGELYAYLAQNRGLAFVNRDNSFLIEMAQEHCLSAVAYYGNGHDNYISGHLANATPLTVAWRRNNFGADENVAISNLTGTYNLENILAAICVGSHFKLSSEEINKGISEYLPVNNRSQLTKTAKNTLICDFYNANPSSMIVALENLAALQAPKKTIILGDMFELGKDAREEHRIIIDKALSIEANRRIFVGKEFYALKTHAAEFYQTTDEAIKAIQNDPVAYSTILIKGSRGMKFESIVGLF